jgi:hypothetical protein
MDQVANNTAHHFGGGAAVRKELMAVIKVQRGARQKKKSQPMWVIDMQNWLDKLFSCNEVPRLRVGLKKVVEIISYATASLAGIYVGIHPLCWRRPNGRSCRGALEIELMSEMDEIIWRCPVCGNKGTITGWKGEFWDMTSTQLDGCIYLE